SLYRKDGAVPLRGQYRRAAQQLRSDGRVRMHPCDRLEQPGQGDVAICSLLRDEAIEKRAPRGFEPAQRGMNTSQRAEGVRQRVRKAEFAIGCRGGFRV